MSAALYARISTKDKGNINDNQLRELRAFAERLGYAIYREFGDQESRVALGSSDVTPSIGLKIVR